AVAVVLAFAFPVAFAFAFGVAYAFAFAGILAVFLAVVGYIEQAALLAFFFLLLPLLNALADMISVAATRKFLNLMAQSSERGWNFAFEILSDFLIALLCLFALVWSLTQALELWQHIHPASLPFDWRAYRGQIIPDTQTGGMLYLMVLTTLLPTLLHVGLGAWGMAIYRGQMIGDALSKLKTLELDPDFRALLPMEKSTLTAPVATLIRRAYRKGWWWALTCVAGTLALFLAGIWGGTALLQSLGVSPFAL
ncbi:MAG: hypothetical protein HRU33_10695, partial [Rhodobacteraceae bacterium]|nr:hypothetical protein [Paracoccaceae bacterium]